jgi:hypothetical protein
MGGCRLIWTHRAASSLASRWWTKTRERDDVTALLDANRFRKLTLDHG